MNDAPLPFNRRLDEAMEKTGSLLCVGLDPRVDRLEEPVEDFCRRIIDATWEAAVAFKPNAAFFEALGLDGHQRLATVLGHCPPGRIMVLDAKRGDIGISAEHYAAAAAGIGAHAITVSGYLGMSTVEPYLKAGLGVFVLVRTSNPDSDTVQSECLTGGETVAEMMARRVAALGKGWMGASGMSSVGAVVGATKAADAKALRAIMPEQFFLVPGYGAQGGTADDVRAMLTPARGGVLVTASRSVIYPTSELGVAWQAAVSRAAKGFASEVAAVIRV